MTLRRFLSRLREAFHLDPSRPRTRAARRRATFTPGRDRQRPSVEPLEDRTVPAVTILNGGGSGYVGNGSGGPPDVTGMAGTNSYIEVTNDTVTIFNKSDPRTIIDQHPIGDFFYNPAIGAQTLIYNPTFNIVASPTGATELGTTVTITTTAAHGFVVGQQVTVS